MRQTTPNNLVPIRQQHQQPTTLPTPISSFTSSSTLPKSLQSLLPKTPRRTSTHLATTKTTKSHPCTWTTLKTASLPSVSSSSTPTPLLSHPAAATYQQTTIFSHPSGQPPPTSPTLPRTDSSSSYSAACRTTSSTQSLTRSPTPTSSASLCSPANESSTITKQTLPPSPTPAQTCLTRTGCTRTRAMSVISRMQRRRPCRVWTAQQIITAAVSVVLAVVIWGIKRRIVLLRNRLAYRIYWGIIWCSINWMSTTTSRSSSWIILIILKRAVLSRISRVLFIIWVSWI